MTNNAEEDLIWAVRNGYVETSKNLIKSFGLSHFTSWSNGYKLLYEALLHEHLKVTKLLLKSGSKVNSERDDCKTTPLHLAVKNNYPEIVAMLLRRGAKIDYRDDDGKTVLCVAVEKVNFPIVRQILKFYPDVRNEVNRNSLYVAMKIPWRPNLEAIVDALMCYGFELRDEDAFDAQILHAAVKQGFCGVVNTLFKFGADANMTYSNNRRTPLHTAASHGQFNMASFLISKGANIDTKDKSGKCALYFAVLNCNENITKLLLRSGAKVTTYSLEAAVQKGCSSIVKILLKRTPDTIIHDCDKSVITPLHNIVLNKVWHLFPPGSTPAINDRNNKNPPDIRVEMVEMFLSRGARVNAKTKCGSTALHFAAQRGYVKVVEVLLKHKAHVNSLTERQTSPLHLAATKNNKTIVKMLLDSGAHVNCIQSDGATPLHIASKYGHDEVVKLLVERGACIDAQDIRKSTPLHLATINGYADVVQTLLTLGANVELIAERGRTALHLAAKHGWRTVAEVLLNHGADINATCRVSLTPLDYAMVGTHEVNSRPDGRRLNSQMQYDVGDAFFDYYHHNHDFLDLSDYEEIFDDFADYYGNVSDCPCQEVAETLEQHIITIKALDLYVSDRNLKAVDLQFEHQPVFEVRKREIAKMKSKKIGDSSVSFYDVLTREMNEVAAYTRNQSIVETFEAEDFGSQFPSYCAMVERRFRQGQKREILLSSGLKSLTALSGHILSYPSVIQIINYLNDKDLKNLIDAVPNVECGSFST